MKRHTNFNTNYVDSTRILQERVEEIEQKYYELRDGIEESFIIEEDKHKKRIVKFLKGFEERIITCEKQVADLKEDIWSPTGFIMTHFELMEERILNQLKSS